MHWYLGENADSYSEWLTEMFLLHHSKSTSLWERTLFPFPCGCASSAVWPNVATWWKAVNTDNFKKISKSVVTISFKMSKLFIFSFLRHTEITHYLSCASLYLFNLSASSLFSSIHRCKSSSFSAQACDDASCSAFFSACRAANSLDWHSMVNSNSERAAFRVLLPLARVSASWR